MKLLFFALFTCCLFSCDDEPDNGQTIVASIEFLNDYEDPTVTHEAGNVDISFTSTTAWTASVSANASAWCSLPEGQQSGSEGENIVITASVIANETKATREATITLKSVDGSVTKFTTITQTSTKIKIIRGVSNNEQEEQTNGEGPIEGAFDGNYTGSRFYHSQWSGFTEPVVNEFFFTEEGATKGFDINQIIITPRTGPNTKGLLETFKVYVKTADTEITDENPYGVEVLAETDFEVSFDKYTKTFDTQSNVTSVVLVHTKGHGGVSGHKDEDKMYVAYHEVEFFIN